MLIADVGPTTGAEPVLFSLVALGIAAPAGLAWSGWWRSWVGHPHGLTIITLAPPFSAAVLVMGFAGAAPDDPVRLTLVAAVTLWLVAGFVLQTAAPRWYGPRWLREHRAAPWADPTVPLASALVLAPPSERESERLAREAQAPAEPIGRRPVLFLDPALGRPTARHLDGAARGHLLMYDDELVFVADLEDDATRPGPTIRVLAAETITAVRSGERGGLVDGVVRQTQVCIDVAEGPGWTLEPHRPQDVLAELRRTYPATDRRRPKQA